MSATKFYTQMDTDNFTFLFRGNRQNNMSAVPALGLLVEEVGSLSGLEILCPNQKVRRVLYSQPVEPILRQLHAFYALTTHFITVHLYLKFC
jgi:hypothetical protein